MDRHLQLGVVCGVIAVALVAFPASMPLSLVHADLGDTAASGTYKIRLINTSVTTPTDDVIHYDTLSERDQAIVDNVIESGAYERSYGYKSEDPYPDRLPVGYHDHPAYFVVAANGTYYEMRGHSTFLSLEVDVNSAIARLNAMLTRLGGLLAVVSGVYLSGRATPHARWPGALFAGLGLSVWLAVYVWPFSFLTIVLVMLTIRVVAVGVVLFLLATTWRYLRPPPASETVATAEASDESVLPDGSDDAE